jgi:hypothetical protein
MVMSLPVKPSVVGSMIDPSGFASKCFDFGMDSDVDIGKTVFVRYIFFRYWNNRCGCQISDIADIKIDVDAHLWRYEAPRPGLARQYPRSDMGE